MTRIKLTAQCYTYLIVQWCRKNLGDDSWRLIKDGYILEYSDVEFDNAEDAIAFKLIFEGTL